MATTSITNDNGTPLDAIVSATGSYDANGGLTFGEPSYKIMNFQSSR
jgi:hypothetical protein